MRFSFGSDVSSKDTSDHNQTVDLNLFEQFKRFQKYLPLAERSSDAILVADDNGTILYINKAGEKVSGYKPKELIGKNAAELIGAKKIDVKSYLKKGSILVQVVHKNGDKIWMEGSAFKINIFGKTYPVAVGRDITKRKQNEQELIIKQKELVQAYEKLKQQEQILNVTFEQTAVGMMFVNSHTGELLRVNKAMCKLLGYSKKELLNKTFMDITHPNQLKESMQVLQELNDGAIDNFSLEKQYIKKNGSSVWIKLSVSPVKNDRGKILHNVAIVQDIQDLKHTIDELRHSKKLLGLAQTSGRIGIFEYDIKTQKADWTAQLEHLYGLAAGGFQKTYSHWLSMVLPEDREKAEKAIKSSIKNSRFEVEFRIIWPNGSIHWIYARGKTYYDKKHNPLKIVGLNMDITLKKKIEEKLAQSELRFRLMAENMLDIVVIHGKDKRYLYASPSIEKLFGLKPKQIIGKSYRELGVLEEICAIFDKALDTVFKTRKPFVFEYPFNDSIYFQALLTPEMNGTDDVQSVLVVSRDITHLKQLEQRKDEFLSIASHELKTPLTSVKAYGQLLLSRLHTMDTQQIEDILQKQHTYINRLNVLISDLLDLSRIQAGRFKFSKEIVSYRDFVNSAVNAVRPISVHKIIVKGASKRSIYGDANRLEQVLINLLSNAVKYSPQAQKVLLTIVEDKQNVLISVKDFGIGIPKKDWQNMFNRFFRSSLTEKQYAGMGIGLYISKQIIERHHGKIWFESRVGKGSTFFISLPLYTQNHE